jgi:hypothetical protein
MVHDVPSSRLTHCFDETFVGITGFERSIDVHEGGARSGVLRRSARNRSSREARGPARQALRPGCEELAVRIRRKCRRWKRGPRPKIATVERREARLPLPREAGTPPGAWPATLLRAYRVPLHPGRLSALRPPLDRGGK